MNINTFALVLTAISLSLPVSAQSHQCLEKKGSGSECLHTCAGGQETVGQQEAGVARQSIVGKWVMHSLTHHAEDNVQLYYELNDIPANAIFTEYFEDGTYVTSAHLQGRHIIVHGQYQLGGQRGIRLVTTRILRNGTEHSEDTGIPVSGDCELFEQRLVVTLPEMLSEDVQMAGLTTEYVYSRFEE